MDDWYKQHTAIGTTMDDWNKQYNARGNALEALSVTLIDLAQSVHRKIDEATRLLSVNNSAQESLRNFNKLTVGLSEYQLQFDATRVALQGALQPVLTLSPLGSLNWPEAHLPAYNSYASSIGRINYAIAEATFIGEISLNDEEERAEDGETDNSAIENQLIDIVPESAFRQLRMLNLFP